MMIDLILKSTFEELRGKSKEEISYEVGKRIDQMITKEGWYVICSVSGEKIPYNDLRYWSVEHQRCWARPELIDYSLNGYTRT